MGNIAQAAQKETRVKVGITLPQSVDRAVEREATDRDVPKQQLIEEAIRHYLNLAEAA